MALYRTCKRRIWLALGALILLFGFVGRASAAPSMCTITGTVYNIDGSVAAKGSVMIRAVQTQTFSGDTVNVSPEYITLDNSGNLPAGVQVPLGSRIFIQVGRDKPVSVVAPTSGGSCPITFGALYGSALSSPPPATTIVTSIGATNNAAGLTLSTTNPAGAGPANIALAASGIQNWTPTITGSGSNPTVTYTAQVGRYVQYGNVFMWYFQLTWSAFSGGSGNMTVSGFPLTPQNTANLNWVGAANQFSGLTLGGTTPNFFNTLGCQLNPNVTTFFMVESGNNVTVQDLPVSAAGSSGQIICEGWGSQ